MEIVYNKANDSLLILWTENRPAVSRDVNGEFWLREVPETKEIIGIEIEDFELFVKRHTGKYSNEKT